MSRLPIYKTDYVIQQIPTFITTVKMEAEREHSTKNFWKHLTMSFKFTSSEGHSITAFPGKLKGVLHSQEDGTNIFPSQMHSMSELCAFHREHP